MLLKSRGRVIRCVHRAIFMYTISLVQIVLCQILIDRWPSTHWRISVWGFKCSLRPMFADVFNQFFFFLLTHRSNPGGRFFAWELCACVCVCASVAANKHTWQQKTIRLLEEEKRGASSLQIVTEKYRWRRHLFSVFSLFSLSFQEVILPPVRGHATAPVPKYVAGIGQALFSSSSSSPATSSSALSFWPRPTTPSNRERG